MASEKRLSVLITANAKQARGEFGALGADAEKAGRRTERALSGMHAGLAGLGVATAAYASFKAFEDSERIARQTEAVIKSTGGEANITASQVGDLAGEISKLGGVDDEAAQAGANMLLTFTKVRNEVGKGNDIFNQASMAASDYAAATGTDVVAANKLLGKALNDPIKGMGMLTKAGVQLTDQQEANIRAFVKQGDVMNAQKVILKEFEKQYGGSLEANATATGKMQVALENMGETVGGVLAPTVEKGAGAIASLAEAFSGLPDPAQQAIVGIGGVTTAALVVGPRVVEMGGMVKQGASALLNFAGAGTSATGALSKSAAAIGGIPGAAAAAAVGVGVLAVAYTSLTEDSRKAAKGAQELIDAAEATGNTLEEVFDDRLAKTIAGVTGGFDLAGSGKDLGDNLEAMGIDAKAFADALHGTDREYKAFRKTLGEKFQADPNLLGAYETLKADMDVLREAARQADEKSADYARTQKQLGVVQEELGVATAAGTAALGEAKAATAGFLGVNQSLVGSYQRRAALENEINKNLRTQTDLAFGAADAALALKAAHDGVQDSQTALNEARASGDPEQIQRAEDNLTAAIMRESQATLAAAEASAQAQGKSLSAAEAANIQRAKLAELQSQTGFTSTELGNLNAQLDRASAGHAVQLDTSQAIANIRSLIGTLQDLAAVGSATGAAGSIVGAGVTGVVAIAGQRASGGPVSAGKLYEVNERGTELFAPSMNGTILDAGKTKQMLGGTTVNAGTQRMGGGDTYLTVNVNVAGNVTSERDLAGAIARELNRSARFNNPMLIAGVVSKR